MPTMWAAAVAGIYDYLVIDLLGSSLDQLYRKNDKQVMDLRSVVCIAMQVVSSRSNTVTRTSEIQSL
jgi:F420-0:gamma-glutamyl ligase